VLESFSKCKIILRVQYKFASKLHDSYFMIYTVRESQERSTLFYLGQGKSGNIREIQGNLQWSGDE